MLHICIFAPHLKATLQSASVVENNACPWGLSSSCWLLGAADFTMWCSFTFVCRSLLQWKSNNFLKSIRM